MRRDVVLGLMAVVMVVLVVGSPYEAHACTCLAPGPVAQEFEEASAVFVGSVVEGQREERTLKLKMAIHGSWKGVDVGEVELWTAQDTAACGYPFEQGRRYIVYAAEAEGRLWASLCSRTRQLQGSEEESRVLDEVSGVEVSRGLEGGESVGSGYFSEMSCLIGEELQIEEWGCAMPLGEDITPELWLGVGERLGLACHLYGVPLVKRWRCVEPAPALR